MTAAPPTLDDVVAGLAAQGYLADDGLATAVLLALRLHRPLLVEGEPGVGKTELARALAAWTGGQLLRLQCWDGMTVHQAVYDWDHARQLLHLRAREVEGAAVTADDLDRELFTERFLVRRPVLAALAPTEGPVPVLLIDELDRADDEFEAYLLEVLADHAVTIPELGTVRAERPPIVVITANRTRELHDALRRRCLYHWVDHPDPARELAIVRTRVPAAAEPLAVAVVDEVQRLRALPLSKPPGVAETVDWARALVELGATGPDQALLTATLGVVVKDRDDLAVVRAGDGS